MFFVKDVIKIFFVSFGIVNVEWRIFSMFDYGARGPGFDSHIGRHFFGSSHLPSF